MPNLKNKEIYKLKNKEDVVISIVTPFYNAGKLIEETAKTVFYQTYPYFEWIIVDDGSKDKESLKVLEKIKKSDSRVKVFHQENGGPASARDNGISKCSYSSKYVLFLDSDDMMENTMLEHMYWTLETHPEASFTYTAMVNFGARNFYWEPYITLDQQKKDNLINISTMVKKEDLLEVGCFGLREKGIYEDWNLWLKLLAAKKIPIRMNAPVFWYRTNDDGEFSRAKNNHARAMEIINSTAMKIKEDVPIIQYPKICNNYNMNNYLNNMTLPQYEKGDKKNVLFLFPWAIVGGADIFNLELLRRLDKNKFNCIVLTLLPSKNPLRQEMEDFANEFYDLSNFLDYKDYSLFVKYLVKSRNIDVAFVSNTVLGYALLSVAKSVNPNILTVDYVHSIDLKDYRGGFGKYSKEFHDILDVSLTCNKFTESQLIKDYDKDNVEVVYIGTDENKYDIKNIDVEKNKKKYNIPSDKKVVGFIARLSYEKRPEFFVEIAKKLLEKRDDLLFLIGGDGPLTKKMHELINKEELNDHIKMLGIIKNSEEFYALCDVTVNCSLLEGLALTSYESLSMGVPVVSADIGGQAELINDKVGRVISNSFKDEEEELNLYVDSIIDVLNDLKNIKKECRLRIKEGFTLDLMTKQMESIFERKATKTDNVVLADIIYNNYALKMKDYTNGLTRFYFETYYGVFFQRDGEYSKFSKIKAKFKGFAKKYDLHDEIYFVFKDIRYLYIGLRLLFYSMKHFIKFIIFFIPMILYFIYSLYIILKIKIKNILNR